VAIALENKGLIVGLWESFQERTVPSREAERIKASVGEETALTYFCYSNFLQENTSEEWPERVLEILNCAMKF